MTSEPISELDILAYADGHLDRDPQRKAIVEEAMRVSPDLAWCIADLCAQTAALRKAYNPKLAEDIPARLNAVLQSPNPPRMRKLAQAATIVLLVAGSAAAGWFGGRMGTPPPGATLEELGHAHLDTPATAAPPRHIETVSTQAMQPVTSLDSGVSLTLPEPDLSALGYSLSGRESIMSERGRTLRLTYSDNHGDSFALLLRPRGQPRKTDVRLSRRGDISVAHWLDGTVELTVAARLPDDRILGIAEKVREAMQDNQNPLTLDDDRLEQAPRSLSAENTVLPSPELQDNTVAEPPRLRQ